MSFSPLKVLKRDIPWETYMTTKLISGTGLQLLRRYDNRAESVRAQLLDDDGPAYVQVFVNILRDIFKEETVEYVLALIDEMLTANPKRARLFHDKSLANEDTYEPFLIACFASIFDIMLKICTYAKGCDLSSKVLVTMWSADMKCFFVKFENVHPCTLDFLSCTKLTELKLSKIWSTFRLLWKGNWFIQEKSCKILALIVSARPKTQDGVVANGENSKKKGTTINDVLKELVEWLCTQLKKPSHPTCGIPTAINCLASLLKEPVVRSSFVQADGVKLLIPLITPASTQQSIQLLYETCLCVWLLSYYEPAIEYLATSRALPRLVDVVRSSTKEKVVRVVVLTFRNLLSKGTFGAQMVDLGLPQIVQSLKAQAWSDEDLLEALNHLEDGLKDNIKKLSSFDKYKQEVLLGHLDWSPMHKDPLFWRDNVSCFEENDFQCFGLLLCLITLRRKVLPGLDNMQLPDDCLPIENIQVENRVVLRVLITIMETSSDPRALAVACFDLSQFIQHHPAGRVIVNDLKAKERVMKLMNHDSAEVTKNALLCIQRLFLGAKYASFLQA
ncbi:hypothetical protein CXB51_020790 [Gossypium anomalum]|uniref:ATPase V1 complex subunit H C-terminal domain-containing protein n=2 Tax=Gossypium TaxID=3633 RepID=A0A8J5YQR2_9ROSI|nr:hypothetical protein CXB51_020790 [Gossypium anomalum]